MKRAQCRMIKGAEPGKYFKGRKPLISNKIDKQTLIIGGIALIVGALVLSSALNSEKRALSYTEIKSLCRKNYKVEILKKGKNKTYGAEIKIKKIRSGIEYGKVEVSVKDSSGIRKKTLEIGDEFKVFVDGDKIHYRLLSISGNDYKFCVY